MLFLRFCLRQWRTDTLLQKHCVVHETDCGPAYSLARSCRVCWPAGWFVHVADIMMSYYDVIYYNSLKNIKEVCVHQQNVLNGVNEPVFLTPIYLSCCSPLRSVLGQHSGLTEVNEGLCSLSVLMPVASCRYRSMALFRPGINMRPE